MAKNDTILQETLNDILDRLAALEETANLLQMQIDAKSTVYKDGMYQKSLILSESNGTLTITTTED